MKKRLMCLALVFVLTFSAAMRPRQEAYAFAATATVATVALALIAACGVTFVSGNSRSISATVDDFLEKNAGVKSFIENLISNFGAGGKILLTEIHLYPWVKEGFSNLISAVRSYFSGDAGEGLGGGSVSIEAPSAAGWNISTDVVSETFRPDSEDVFVPSSFLITLNVGDSNGYWGSTSIERLTEFPDNAGSLTVDVSWFDGVSVFHRQYKGSAEHYSLLMISSSDVVASKTQQYSVSNFLPSDNYGFFFSGPQGKGKVSFRPCYPTSSSSYRLQGVFCITSSAVLVTGAIFDGQNYGSLFGFDHVDWNDIFASLPSVPYGGTGTAASDFVYAYPADVTPDLLAQKWADALDAEGADIVINPVDAGELVGAAGYDVAYGTDTAAGAIVGVDLPAIPAEVPDTPVIPGEDTADLSGIMSKLGSILSGIKALPGQIADTVIGTGELDWSALQGVSFKTVFPFCIPFDLADALTSLRASPKEPLWEVDFSGTAFAPAGAVVIDLRTFSRLFAIIRFFVYGGFVVSLIVLTRKLIKG